MKFFICFVIFVCFVPFAFASASISEIGFVGDEFVEIFSDSELNLSEARFYDENSGFNSLSLVQEVDSPIYLVVGENFLSSFDVSLLNCSVYSSGLSTPGKYGLKDSGESVRIEKEGVLNVSWEKTTDFSFGEDESLNFDFETGGEFVFDRSVCSFSFLNNEIINESSDLGNESIDESFSCGYFFDLEIDDRALTDKVEFDFDTDADNFTILYWVESFGGEVVKSARETTNTNKKSYTPPDRTEVYRIFGVLEVGNCSLSINESFVFYSPFVEDEEEGVSEDLSYDKESYISVLNEDDLVSLKTNFLKYDIYRGDTNKRVVSFFLNGDKVGSLDIGKWEKVKGQIMFDFAVGRNDILIDGLDLSEEVVVFFNGGGGEIVNNGGNKDFEILNLSVLGSDLSFCIDTSYDGVEGSCSVLHVRTKVSDVLNLSSISSFESLVLRINENKLKEREDDDFFLLKLSCKYRKAGLKSYKYEGMEFNYSFEENGDKGIEIGDERTETERAGRKREGFEREDLEGNMGEEIDFDFYVGDLGNLGNNGLDFEKVKINDGGLVYVSDNVRIGEGSYLPVFAGAVLLLSVFVIFW